VRRGVAPYSRLLDLTSSGKRQEHGRPKEEM
jgi:hypothetical protein